MWGSMEVVFAIFGFFGFKWMVWSGCGVGIPDFPGFSGMGRIGPGKGVEGCSGGLRRRVFFAILG